MIKKIFVFLAILLVPVFIYAQSMTDKQIMEYVQKEQAKGSSQQKIVNGLLQKGVTVEQIRNLKKKYEEQQKNASAVDLMNGTETNINNRTRTKEQIEADTRQQKNNFMLRSNGQIMDEQNKNIRRDMMNQEISFLDIDSLIYYKNMFKEGPEVFGRNIFNNQMLSFEASANIPTPADYVLGAGDQVYIDIWGASQNSIEGVISPDGTVTLDAVGPVKLAGMTVDKANSYLKAKLAPLYSASNVSLTVGTTRSIQVQVMGEVVMPGTYTISAFATAFNALYLAGGINTLGTLRNIKVYRHGKQVSVIDVYDYILNGNSRSDIRLEDNDVIVVGPYDCIVNVSGKVKRPMLYEMKADETLSTLVRYSGGFSGNAYKDKVRLIRKSGREYSIHTVGEFEMQNFKLADGDSVYVDSILPRFSNMVEVNGAVFYPGQYELGKDIATVRDLIEAAEGLREDAFVSRAVLHHRGENKIMEVVQINLSAIMDGSVPDVPLKNNDMLFIPSKMDMRPNLTYTIGGEVNFPGVYKYANNTTLEDFILQAGGLTDAASLAKIDVFRRILDRNASQVRDTLIQKFSFSVTREMKVDSSATNFVLSPFDEVYVRKSPAYSEQQNVTINGAVNYSGDYAMTSRTYRLSDLVQAAGGLTEYSYSKGARLERKMTEAEKKQLESALKSSQIQMYEESMQAEKAYNMANADSLLNLKMDLGERYSVAINLDKALANPGGADDITLREGDVITVPQYSNTVKISGEVLHPISINYVEGKPLSYYIKRAGGYSSRAWKSRVNVIYMNGAGKQLGRRTSADIQPGCEIVVPSKSVARKMTTTEMLSIGTSTASIATMVATLINVLK